MKTRISLEEIASALNISSGSATSMLLNRLSYHKVCARWIHNILTPQQKRDRVAYSTALLKMYENCDPRHLDELITGDETWLHYFEPFRKAMNKPWASKGADVSQIASQCRSKKILYTIFVLLKGHCATQTTQGRNEYHGGDYKKA